MKGKFSLKTSYTMKILRSLTIAFLYILFSSNTLAATPFVFNHPPQTASFQTYMGRGNTWESNNCVFSYCIAQDNTGISDYQQCLAALKNPKKAHIAEIIYYTYLNCEGPLTAITISKNGEQGFIKANDIGTCPFHPDKAKVADVCRK